MSYLVRPPMNSPSGRDDNLDTLLSRYFQSALPASWPDCPAPAEEPTRMVIPVRPTAAGSWLEFSRGLASRLALALSLLILLAGPWLLSGQFHAPKASPTPSADVVREQFDPTLVGPASAERKKQPGTAPEIDWSPFSSLDGKDRSAPK